MDRYVLIGKVPVPEPDLHAWARWFEESKNRIVQQDHVGSVLVSTVFLGLDHNWSKHGPPLLFETMIFDGEHDGYQVRTSTWELALAEHAKALELER